MIPRSFAIALLIAIAGPASAGKPHYEIGGRVVKIADGDTLTILVDNRQQGAELQI
jgi:endonuclease YncB( thermonuclease family)